MMPAGDDRQADRRQASGQDDRKTCWQDNRKTGWQDDRKIGRQEDRRTGWKDDMKTGWQDDRKTCCQQVLTGRLTGDKQACRMMTGMQEECQVGRTQRDKFLLLLRVNQNVNKKQMFKITEDFKQ
jgi:hypothetical protein